MGTFLIGFLCGVLATLIIPALIFWAIRDWADPR